MTGLKNHDSVVKIKGFGTDGVVVRPKGQRCPDLVYILMEYVEGGILFDFVQKMGGSGEQAGR